MAFVAAASTHDDVPGKRHGIELELSRTFSSEIVRDLQSPDTARAVRAALALGLTKDERAYKPLILRSRRGCGCRCPCDLRLRHQPIAGFDERRKFTHHRRARRTGRHRAVPPASTRLAARQRTTPMLRP